MFTEYPINTPDLIDALTSGLGQIQGNGVCFPGNAEYTTCVLSTLAKAAKAPERGYKCYPDRTENKKECLWDCSWWKEDAHLDLVLAAESEWSEWSDIRYDFDKLIAAKCPVKLLVTGSGSGCPRNQEVKEFRNTMRKKIQGRLRQHSDHIQGERYVWTDVQGSLTGGKIYAYEFTVPEFLVEIKLQPVGVFEGASDDTPTAAYQFASLAIPIV